MNILVFGIYIEKIIPTRHRYMTRYGLFISYYHSGSFHPTINSLYTTLEIQTPIFLCRVSDKGS